MSHCEDDLSYSQLNLTSDVGGTANNTDARLQNPWGLVVRRRELFAAVNENNYIGKYNLSGVKLQEIATGPKPIGLADAEGTAFSANNTSLIVVTEEGGIEVWRPPATQTVVVVPPTTPAPDKKFTGVVILNNLLYVADFENKQIKVYNTSFQFLNNLPQDTSLTDIDYSPFNLYVHNGKLYIAYALRGAAPDFDEIAAPGNGYVNVFSNNMYTRLVSRGPLNAPWGLAIHCDVLYVGNFGDGVINAFELGKRGVEFIDNLRTEGGGTIVNDGLWAIVIRPRSNSIWFTAGSQDEEHGLIGVLRSTHRC